MTRWLWLVAIVLLFLGVVIGIFGATRGLADTAGSLAGSLIGVAGVFAGLLAGWEFNERQRIRGRQARRARIKALVAAELANVAAGLIDAKRTMDVDLRSREYGAGAPPEHVDLTRDMPRPMPFTDSLGAQLLVLGQREIDGLATLRSNLEIIRTMMTEITSGRRQFTELTARQLREDIRYVMRILAQAFELIAPERRFEFPGAPPELASDTLRRLANDADDGGNAGLAG